MAHFAELDSSNIVLRVVVIPNEHEVDGENWCNQFFGGGTWRQTSYNASIRKNFAGVGYTYDPALDAFIPPQPYPSWIFDTATCQWKAPVDMPNDGNQYFWNEVGQEWMTQS
jgi:hypothetical protein